MTTAGIDIGGTKIEVQVFDQNWVEVARHRVATPKDYPSIVAAVGDQIDWAAGKAGPISAVGIGAAGLVHPETGHAFTANLAASGHPFPADIAKRAGRDVTYVNDCRALALSEAVFGAGKDKRTVMALIIGTGVGGGIAVDQALLPGPTATGGEFGHTSAPAHIVAAHGLPLYQCGCGRMGCIETYIAGPGLERLAKFVTGADITTKDIAARRDADMAQVWSIWCAFTAEMIHSLTLTVDPDVIVLGGGLSAIPGVIEDLTVAAGQTQIAGFNPAPIVLAQGGDASGARGAAYAAWQDMQNV